MLFDFSHGVCITHTFLYILLPLCASKQCEFNYKMIIVYLQHFFIIRVKVVQEFQEMESPSEELSPGQPFQPDFIYDMLRDLKSDCLKVKIFDL